MNIIFMGTPDLARTVFESLLDSKHNIIAAVTQPDRPKGRGKKLVYSPVKELAISHKIPVLQPIRARDKDFIKELKSYSPDIIVVAAFGQILPKEILDLPKYGCINVHTSLLPRYRGASPIQWAIINGDKKTGITIMHMDIGLDTGDIILQKEVIIDKKETAQTLHDKLAVCGGKLVLEAIDLLELGKASRVKQDDTKATHVKTLNKTIGEIDFTMTAVEIERRIRGLNPWPSAYTFLNGQSLKIWQADVFEEFKKNDAKPGEVVQILSDRIIVKTGKGYLKVLEIQMAGKKRMQVSQFLRGNSIELGTVLGNRQ